MRAGIRKGLAGFDTVIVQPGNKEDPQFELRLSERDWFRRRIRLALESQYHLFAGAVIRQGGPVVFLYRAIDLPKTPAPILDVCRRRRDQCQGRGLQSEGQQRFAEAAGEKKTTA